MKLSDEIKVGLIKGVSIKTIHVYLDKAKALEARIEELERLSETLEELVRKSWIDDEMDCGEIRIMAMMSADRFIRRVKKANSKAID